jgi:hypothetical protein
LFLTFISPIIARIGNGLGMSFPLRATAFALAVTFVAGQLTKPFPVSAAQTQTSETSFGHFLQVRAAVSTKGALVEWRTGLERDTLGFNIYRIKSGERTQLNPGLIAGSALMCEAVRRTIRGSIEGHDGCLMRLRSSISGGSRQFSHRDLATSAGFSAGGALS